MDYSNYRPPGHHGGVDRTAVSGPTPRGSLADLTAEQARSMPYHDDHVKLIAARACLACRRLKMKCVGSSRPPCVRCHKAGRACEFQPADQNQSTQTQLSRPVLQQPSPPEYSRSTSGRYDPRPGYGSGLTITARGVDVNDKSYSDHSQRVQVNDPASHPKAQPVWTPVSPDLSTPGVARESSDIPSIYSTSPFDTVVEENHSATPNDATQEAFDVQPRTKRQRIDYTSSNSQMLEIDRTQDQNKCEEPLSERDMTQIIEVFRQRHLGNIPILDPEDFEDIRRLREKKKSLAYCACYVTARFLPTGNAIRAQLLPFVALILETRFVNSKAVEEDDYTTLQALIVLYAYAQASPEWSNTSAHPDLKYWRLKALTETYAIQLHVHRSADAVKFAKKTQVPHISKSHSYKMYTYWLWLYTMAHHSSLVTRTPPTIRADATIRTAPTLLNEIGMSSRIKRLMGEVELCLYWEKASIQETGLGEWWCLPEPGDDTDDSTRTLVYEIDNALKSWSKTWSDIITAASFKGVGLDFHLRFTRFCISTYSIRNLKLCGNKLTASQKRSIVTSVEAAANLLNWALDLGPASKDRLRYMCDFGFVIISFCCFFIIQTCQAFGSEMPEIVDYLGMVRETAQLMTALAVDFQHAPGQYGRSILARLDNEEKPAHESIHGEGEVGFQGSSSSTPVASRTPRWSGLDHFDYATNDLNSFMTDPIWDFSELFPDMLCN